MKTATMKAKIVTESIKAEIEGPLVACIVDSICYVRGRAERESILLKMQAAHYDMCELEARRASEKP